MQTSLRAIPYLVLLAALLAAGRLPAQPGGGAFAPASAPAWSC